MQAELRMYIIQLVKYLWLVRVVCLRRKKTDYVIKVVDYIIA